MRRDTSVIDWVSVSGVTKNGNYRNPYLPTQIDRLLSTSFQRTSQRPFFQRYDDFLLYTLLCPGGKELEDVDIHSRSWSRRYNTGTHSASFCFDCTTQRLFFLVSVRPGTPQCLGDFIGGTLTG